MNRVQTAILVCALAGAVFLVGCEEEVVWESVFGRAAAEDAVVTAEGGSFVVDAAAVAVRGAVTTEAVAALRAASSILRPGVMFSSTEGTEIAIASAFESESAVLSELKQSADAYAWINSESMEPGSFVRIAGGNTVVFNNGNADIFESLVDGDVVYHYEIRDGAPISVASTRIADGGSRLNYFLWNESRGDFEDAGYGLLNRAEGTIRIYDSAGNYVNTLRYVVPGPGMSWTRLAADAAAHDPGNSGGEQSGGSLSTSAPTSAPDACSGSNQSTAPQCVQQEQKELHAEVAGERFDAPATRTDDWQAKVGTTL